MELVVVDGAPGLEAALATRFADVPVQRIAAKVSSGSFLTDGMAIVPCSMNTLAAIANGLTSTLISRSADVTLKEGRKLLLLIWESPLTAIHLENMLRLAGAAVIIAPPVPAFYTKLSHQHSKRLSTTRSDEYRPVRPTEQSRKTLGIASERSRAFAGRGCAHRRNDF